MTTPYDPSDAEGDTATPPMPPPPAQPAQEAAAAPPAPPAPYGTGYGPAPATPDTRPKVIAIVSLILAGLGLIATAIGLIPVLGLPFAIVGGLLVLGGLVCSIIALASRRQGGKALGIAALIVSVFGGIVFAVALFVSVVMIGLVGAATSGAAVPDDDVAAPSQPLAPSDDADDSAPEGNYDEQAFLAQLRPEITDIITDINGDISEEQIDAAYSDEQLVSLGSLILSEYESGGDDVMAQEVQSLVDSSGGMFDQAHAQRFMEALLSAAQAHLQH